MRIDPAPRSSPETDEGALRRALQERPTDPALWANLGRTLRARGHSEEAIACYRRAAGLPGAPAAVFFNLGNALYDGGALDEAEAEFERALRLDPDLAAASIQAGRCAAKAGRLAKARGHFAAALRREPDNFSALLESGHLCRRLGEPDLALAAYRRAVAAAPRRWEGLLALARACEEGGHDVEAAAAYHRATRAAAGGPALRHLHRHMAADRLERGDAPRALEALREALAAARAEPSPDPEGIAEIQADLFAVLNRLGIGEAAREAFAEAGAATGEALLVRLAEQALGQNLWREALDLLRRNVSLRPGSARARYNLAHGLSRSWLFEEALAELERAEAIAPEPAAASLRASAAAHLGDPDRAFALYRALAEEQGPASEHRSSAAMCTLYSDSLTPPQVAAIHRELFAPLAEGARPRASFRNDPDPDRRLRVGLVTPDLHHQHPVNIFLQPMLARLSGHGLDLAIYATGKVHDGQTQVARARVGLWVEAGGLTDERLAHRIEADGVDVLVDLAGHTTSNRARLFARRAAPVQVTYLGYPGSTGVPNVDFLVGDPVVTPEGCDPLYSERVMRLPDTVFCFAPEADYPFPRFDDACATRPLTFGSFNTVTKLTPRTIRLWARVLDAVPDARLLLKAPSFSDPGAIRLFAERFAAVGIGPDRLELRGPSGLDEMMAEYAEIDIGLDPMPYNGGTTTLQALWMGVPVVCGLGGNFVSRMGASFMGAAGLPAFVAADDDAYVAAARNAAADRTALLALKRSLRERLRGAPAWDADRYARAFAGLLRACWREGYAGDGGTRS